MTICSTIIPTVGRDTLRRSVQSALDQGLSPEEYEIIVINDSGRPLEIASWLAEQGVPVINTNRCRLNFACNVGASVARGKYLKFLHDDDYLLPGGLRALIDAAESTGATWVVGGTQVVDDDGQILRLAKNPGQKGNNFAILVAGEVVHMSDCLVLREAFMEVGGFDPIIRHSEDRDLECRLSLAGNVASANHLVACVRIAGISKGSTYRDVQDQTTRYFRLIRERALDLPGAFARLQDSVRGKAYWRGRACRGYLFSAGLNLIAGKVWLAGSRLTCGLRLAGWHVVQPQFWRGLTYRHARQRTDRS